MTLQTNNQDPIELAKFSELASEWWNPTGELKTLHDINPIRVKYIKDRATLKNCTVLDIGCGGGILTESLAKEGAVATGIDLNKSLIAVAKQHQTKSNLNSDYRCIDVETLAIEQPASFDIITCLELLEHVPNPASVIQAAATLVKPGGKLFFSTINRNPKSYLFAIIGAEYILKLIPKNTHDYAKFIKPSELATLLRDANLTLKEMHGLAYNPLTKSTSITDDLSVNYLAYATKE